jgi:uncharacterized protein YggU (UPF0235/DUF167 family)
MGKQARAFIIAAMIAAIALAAAIFVSAEETTEEPTTIQIIAAAYDAQAADASLEERIASAEKDILSAKIYAKVIAGVISFLAAFLGAKTYVDIKKGIDSQLKKILTEKIDGDDPLNNLKRSVRREQQAKQLKVLFAAGEKNDALAGSDYNELRKFFDSQEYRVSDETVWLKADNVKDETKAHDIIVFFVSKEEEFKPVKGAEKTDLPAPKPFYSVLVDHCDEKHQCVLYTPGFFINPEIQKKTYVTTVNLHAKLRETLYMLLYFSPLNKD